MSYDSRPGNFSCRVYHSRSSSQHGKWMFQSQACDDKPISTGCTGTVKHWQHYLGIRTPLLHRMSRSPKGWSPRIYWRGRPRDRPRHIDLNKLRQPWKQRLDVTALLAKFNWAMWTARSLSQRSSLLADLSVRHSWSSSGRRWSCRYASRIVRLGNRGMTLF